MGSSSRETREAWNEGGEKGGEGVRCRSSNANYRKTRREESRVSARVETRSGKLTRPLTNRLTPSLIDFLQRAPFANGVSDPSVASEPVDVTLPDLIAAPLFQQRKPPHPWPRARSSPPERSGPVFLSTEPLRPDVPPEKSPDPLFGSPGTHIRIVGMQDAGPSSSMMPKVTFASPAWQRDDHRRQGR